VGRSLNNTGFRGEFDNFLKKFVKIFLFRYGKLLGWLNVRVVKKVSEKSDPTVWREISEYALLTHHVHSEDALLPLDELFEAPALLVVSPCSMEPSNGVMSSQSNNVVTFVWPPIYCIKELS
jgi:hypothetical protein